MAMPWNANMSFMSSQGASFASTSSASLFPPCNPFATPSPETIEALQRMKSLLNKKLGPELLATRQGAGGSKLTYIEGWRVIALANEVFGFNGWSSEIKNLEVDFIDQNAETGRFTVGVSAVVRVWLRDGCTREDVGYGKADGLKSKAEALDKCRKEAVTDALKRALRTFGNLLGNCIYDKNHVAEVAKMKAPKPAFDFKNLHRGEVMYPDQELTHANAAARLPPPPVPSTPRSVASTPTSVPSKPPSKPVPAPPPVSRPPPSAARPAVPPPIRPTAQQVAARAIQGPAATTPRPPPPAAVRPDTAALNEGVDDDLFAELDLDVDTYAAGDASVDSGVDVSFFAGATESEMPPPALPTHAAAPATSGIDRNVSRPVSRRGGGVPAFHQAAAARPVPAGAGIGGPRLAPPPPELGGFGSARGVKRDATTMDQENAMSGGGGEMSTHAGGPRSPLAEIPLDAKRPRAAPA